MRLSGYLEQAEVLRCVARGHRLSLFNPLLEELFQGLDFLRGKRQVNPVRHAQHHRAVIFCFGVDDRREQNHLIAEHHVLDEL